MRNRDSIIICSVLNALHETSSSVLLKMESNGDGSERGRRLSNSNQQRQRLERPLKKVQVIYYLSRNGQLEHPHFIELPYLPNHQLRLRDVMERLTLLRGEAMPSHFSWSCKRGYKNGYVWNDLAEDDVIYPTDGVEYVLKGSEIIPGAYESFRHVPVGGRRQKPLLVSDKPHLELEEEEEESTRHSKCSSRGVSTEEIERVGTRTEQPFDDSSSPPSTSSSEKPGGGNTSQRIEEADHQPFLARGSVLLQIIACGSAAMKGSKTGGGGASKTASAAGSGGELNRPVQGGVSRTTVMEEEEKERLSRSVVEASKCHVHPPLKKSSSCNEESALTLSSASRSSKARIEERKLEAEEEGRGEGVRGKCIPGRRKSSVKQQ